MKAIDMMIKISMPNAIFGEKVPGDFLADLKRSLLEPKRGTETRTETNRNKLFSFENGARYFTNFTFEILNA